MSPIYINNKKIESIYTNNQSIGKVYVGDVLVFQKNNYTGDPFIFTIDTTLGTGDSFDLPLRSGYNYDFTVDWGDGQTSEITSWDDAEKLHTYSTGGVYTISITGLCEAWYFNNSGDRSKLISIEYLNGHILKSLENAFYGCNNLTVVNGDFSGGQQLTNMSGTFDSCTKLTTLTGYWGVSHVTNMSRMFKNCPVFGKNHTLNIFNWDIKSVTTMEDMFKGTPLGSDNVDNTIPTNNVDNTIPTNNYSSILVGWEGGSLPQNNVRLDAPSSKYWPVAAFYRDELENTYGWTINDGGQII